MNSNLHTSCSEMKVLEEIDNVVKLDTKRQSFILILNFTFRYISRLFNGTKTGKFYRDISVIVLIYVKRSRDIGKILLCNANI